MNLWTDDNASMMEAFITSSDLSSLWAAATPTTTSNQPLQPLHSAASTSADPQQQQPPPPPQALIEGAREIWTYGIFIEGASVLGWGDGVGVRVNLNSGINPRNCFSWFGSNTRRFDREERVTTGINATVNKKKKKKNVPNSPRSRGLYFVDVDAGGWLPESRKT
ncbi:hypothetical protein G4B88_003604 [Cannabis sativa]|uniref:Uncharacterized protein n=1 Tax=Cannabis sativa TaxID=3483 RepID=A0A7J6FB27_CANSA|nr:hypothetical protein G4B88_003604 [Cannabis sativa]